MAARAAVKAVLEALLEAEVSAKLGREKGVARRVSSQPREIDWQCGHCGCRDAHHMLRDGHYRRSLQTSWGPIEDLAVPMLECQCCGHDVVCHFAVFDKYERFWFDLDQDVLLGSGLCESLRHLSERWSETVGSSVGLQTRNSRINQILALVEQGRAWSHHGSTCGGAVRWHLAALSAADRKDEAGSPRPGARASSRQEGSAAGRASGCGRMAVANEPSWIGKWPRPKAKPIGNACLIGSKSAGCGKTAGLQAIIRDGKGELGAAVAQVYGGLVLDQRCIFHKLPSAGRQSP